MGRSAELAERFERESAELADLEVRSRMAGRWRMASVQIAFAAMPALVYLFAGLSIAGGGTAITIGTLVAFTTLQTRLFFPIQSLLNGRRRACRARWPCSSASSSTSTCRSRCPSARARSRIPAEEIARRGRLRGASASATSDDGEQVLSEIDLRVPAGDDPGDRRRDRLGQDDARLSARPPLRPERGRG